MLVSATNGKTTTAAMVAAVARARRARASCTTAPARTWPGAWPPRCSTRAARPARSGCSRSTRPGCRAWRDAVRPRAAAAVEPVPRPARPLRRAGAAGRPLGGAGGPAGRGRPRFVLNADDPLVADLGREREGVTYFGVEDDVAGAARAPARGGLQALPELRHALHLRRRVPRPSRPLPLPRLRPGAPAPAVVAARASSSRACPAPASSSRTPGGELVAAPAPAGPLQRLQRGGRGRAGARARRSARDGRGGARGLRRAPSGGSRRSPWTGASCRSCS